MPIKGAAAKGGNIRRALINVLVEPGCEGDRVVQFAADKTRTRFHQNAFFRADGGDGAKARAFQIAHRIRGQIGAIGRARIIQRLAARHRARNLLPDIVIGDENAGFRIIRPLPARIAIQAIGAPGAVIPIAFLGHPAEAGPGIMRAFRPAMGHLATRKAI